MNTLSFILYLADVSGFIDRFASIIGIGGIIIAIIAFTIGQLAVTEENYTGKAEEERKVVRAFAFGLLKYAMPALLLATFIPSQKTLYLIAASEIGEEVVMSETGEKVLNIINDKLDSYTDEGE